MHVPIARCCVVGIRRCIAMLFLCLLPMAAGAVGLTPDLSFNGTGSRWLNVQGFTPHWHFTRIAPDGKIVLVGSICGSPDSTYKRHLAVARMLADGTIDTSFSPASVTPGLAEYDIGGDVFHTAGAAIDSLGRILVAGRTGADETAVVRLLVDGAIDTSFAASGLTPGIFKKSYGANEQVQALALDASERVLVSGHVSNVPYVARLTANGGIDFTFNAAGASPGVITLPQVDYGSATGVQTDSLGRIVVAGIRNDALFLFNTGRITHPGQTQPFVARLTSGGVVDVTFNAAGATPGFASIAGFNDPPYRHFLTAVKLAIDDNDRAVIGGYVRYLGYGIALFRILSDGTEDPTAWSYTPDWPKAAEPLQGPVAFTNPLGAEGVLGGGAEIYEVSDITFDASGRPFLAALMMTTSNDLRLIVYRATASLEPDSGFGPDVIGEAPSSPARGFRVFDVTQVSTNPENKAEGVSLALVTSGLIATTRSVLLDGDGPVLKISAVDGTLVETFGAGGIVFSGQPGNGYFAEGGGRFALSLLADDSLQIADSRIIAQNDNLKSYVLSATRVTAAGIPDSSFNLDGTPLFATSYLPTLDRIAASFQTPPFSASLRHAAGKLVVLSAVQLAGDQQSNIALLRFNADGSIDTTFNAAGMYPGMNRRYISDQGSSGMQIAQDAFDRYYVVGTAGTGGNTIAAFVARFNNNGTNDFSFNDGVNDHVRVSFGTGLTAECSEGESIRVEASGKVYVGGLTQQCSTLGNVIDWRYGAMSRHNDDGSLDGAFNAGGARPGTLLLPIDAIRGVGRMLAPIDDSGGNLLVPHATTPRDFCGVLCLDEFDVRVLRVSPVGVVDAAYGGGAGFIECVACSNAGIGVLAAARKAADGRIYVAHRGAIPSPSTSFTPPIIMRFAPDGSRDTGFGTGGELTLPSSLATGYVVLRDMAFDSLGRLVIQGQVEHVAAIGPLTDLLLQRFTVDVDNDTQPDPFTFNSVSNVALGSLQTSASATISGITTAAPVTVGGGAYSVDCTATYVSIPGSINNGQTVCVRHTASASFSTDVVTTLSIGGVNGSFTSTTIAAPVVKKARDFNGDGKSDLAWRSTGGATALWLMNGTAPTATSVIFTSAALRMNGLGSIGAAVLLSDPNWAVTHLGDFNGDGKHDLLWLNNSTGQTAMWTMNGLGTLSAAVVFASPVWRVTHVYDFDGDNMTDLLWRNSSTGEVAMWRMNGTVPLGSGSVFTNPAWSVAPGQGM